MDSNSQYPTMWTTGYIGNIKVSFTFPIRNEMEAYAQAKAITDKLIADGFTTELPGLEAGEQAYTVTHVARRTQNNKKDGTKSPIIDIYHDDLSFSSLKTWLNTEDEKAAFERATGLKLAQLQPFPATAAIKRGESSEADSYIVKLPRPTKAIWKANPDYVEGSTTEAKRIFIRWETAATKPQPEAVPAVIPATVPAGEPAKDYAAIEAEARRKAATALDNEMVTIFKATYEPNHNGQGVPRWWAMARIADGSSISITVYKEHAAMITKAGYTFPDIYKDSDNLAIPVITAVKGSERHITFVEPLESQPERKWDASAWVDVMEYAKSKGIKTENIKDVLGVDKGGKWTRGYKAAIKEIDKFVGVDFMGVAS